VIDLLTILAQATLPATLPATMPTTAPALPAAVDPFFAFYASNLRGSLFTGFLTLGSFLVAVNTFIIVNLKKELYDSKGYRARVSNARSLNDHVSYFGPLRRLSTFLFWTILLAIATSVSQLTVGLLIPHWAAAAFCLAMACATVIVLLTVLFVIKGNLQDWFEYMEDQAREEAAKPPPPAGT
jgi:hypothetical protein